MIPSVQQKISGFHQDEVGDWVADLACGHTQHVRHNPLWQERPWVITLEGRQGRIGAELKCQECEGEPLTTWGKKKSFPSK
jgi:uncharacterized protein DUF3565